MTLDGLGLWFAQKGGDLKSPRKDVGRKALNNINLSFICHRTNFSTDSGLTTSTDMIKLYGIAIAAAEKLCGIWILYSDGSMERGFDKELETVEASLDIDELWSGLNHVSEVILKETSRAPYDLHFHSEEGGMRRISEITASRLTVY